MNKNYLQLFANETFASDLAPAISVDFASRLANNITELQEALGVTEMMEMGAGNTIKVYKMSQANTPEQVAEGAEIPLTEIKREVVATYDIVLNKYRKNTSAEAIQKVGRDLAINQTDDKLISGIQKDIKKNLYKMLEGGTGTASGATLQSTLANCWGEIKKAFEDVDASPVYFVSSEDVAEYLGTAQITLQNAFGMSYINDFLGLGTVIVSPVLTKGKVIATAKENLNGAYAPASSGDVAQSFGLTSDETGYVGVTHVVKSDNATIDTLAMCGVVFFPEYIDGVIVGSITQA